ncbi:MAG: NifB/NifX family molybdenum-iron cluster-binding protein [Bacillota bacterium]
MKIAVTSEGQGPESVIDPRFGRCRYFLVFDEATGEYTVLPNEQNIQAAQGAGVQAAQHLIDHGVGVVITGNIGPKAFKSLRTGGIRVYTAAGMTVAEAVAAYRAGKLAECLEETVEGDGG